MRFPQAAIATWAAAHRGLAIAAVLGSALVVGALDQSTGQEISFSIFYLLPVGAATWLIGRRAGLTMSVVSAVLWFSNDYGLGGHVYTHRAIPYWNATMRCWVFMIVAEVLSRLKAARQAEHRALEETRSAYVALDQARKDQLLVKDQLLSHVSHELRTPLTALHQFVTILLDGLAGELAERQREYLQIILRNANQLVRMIQDLLDATRAEAGRLSVEPRPIQIADVIADVVSTLRSPAAERGVAVIVDVAPGLPPVLADAARVRQVLTNLLDNALKFTPADGHVSVEIAADADSPEFARVSVTDTGCGMPPEAVANLFQRLYQAGNQPGGSRRGLGLGLYISRDLVQRQGGKMWVHSEVGRGSVFHFTLPWARTESIESEPVEAEEAS